MRLGRLLAPELKNLLVESPEQVGALVDAEHPEDVADLLRDLEPREIATVLAHIPARDGAPVFERLADHEQVAVAQSLSLEKLAYLSAAMSSGRRAHLVRTLPDDVARTLVEALREKLPEAAEELRILDRWPPGTAGHMMSTSFVTLRASMTALEALEAIRNHDARTHDAVEELYLQDERGHVAGKISLRELVFANPSDPLWDLAHQKTVAVAPDDRHYEVARRMAKYDLHVLPVVDGHGTLLGMIAIDDVVGSLTKETTDAAQRLGAVEPLDLPYFQTSLLTFVRKRGLWLFVLFFGEFFTQTALRHYDPVFTAIHGAAYYVPLLISAGGNSGSQSSTLVIRGLAIGEIELRDWWRILAREAGIGLVLGGGLAVVGFLRVLMYPEQHRDFALTVAITLTGIVMTGCTVGSMLPLLLRRIGMDPATSSTPFIASLVDVLGIVIFVHVAKVVMASVLAAP